MNKLKKILQIAFLFLLIFILFKYNYVLKPSVLLSINLWITKVFPSLFIMFILNDIIIRTNILNDLNKIINPFFNKIFKTKGNAFACFFLSIFSGSPTNAYIINENLQKKLISQKTANNLMRYTYFSNPLFLYNILSGIFNKFITFKIIIIHYLANIVIGLFFVIKDEADDTYFNDTNNHENILYILPQSISKSINRLLMILGCITFYMILTNIISLNDTLTTILKGVLEITQGLNILASLKQASIIKEIIAVAIISFGGLSIHTQVLSLTTNNKELYQNYLIGRIYQTLISTGTYILIYLFIAHI